MDKVSDKRSAAQKANDARPNFDGPHKTLRKKANRQDAPSSTDAAYMVSITKKEKNPDDEVPTRTQLKYDAEETRAKARSLLDNGHLTNKERSVLKEILGPDKEES